MYPRLRFPRLRQFANLPHMPLLTADKIHNGKQWLPEYTVIETKDDGEIVAIHSSAPGEALYDNARHFEGALVPGFVNAHCHMELSHLKGAIPEHTMLVNFLKQIPAIRNNYTEEQKAAARYEGYEAMWRNGIAAVGDIANTADTLDIRALGKMHVHTFVECFGFNHAHAPTAFNRSLPVWEAYEAQPAAGVRLRQSMTPHAPYSVSPALFRLLDQHQPSALLSIHNQESPEEDRFYQKKEGGMLLLLQTLGIDPEEFQPSGKSSLQTYLPWLSPSHPMLFVHNTYTAPADRAFAQQYVPQAWWCLCPNANLYIEHNLPDIPSFVQDGCNICVGTDSLSSNHELNILSELCTIKKYFPQISWETLIGWGTYNSACALQMQEVAGSLTPGTKPRIVQLTGLDTEEKPGLHVVA
jgi:aminodeoxyfutalosine deaminase